MNISNFTREEDSDFQIYIWDGEIESDIGTFSAEIQILDDSQLDQNLVDTLATLIESGKKKTKEILKFIYENYKSASDWLEDFDVPSDLPPSEVTDYLDSMTFVVAKDSESERPVDSYIYIIPEWDEEHALSIRLAGDSLEVFNPMAG